MWLIVLFISLAAVGFLVITKTKKKELTGDPIIDSIPMTRVAKKVKKTYMVSYGIGEKKK
jgi:hypothetical protein